MLGDKEIDVELQRLKQELLFPDQFTESKMCKESMQQASNSLRHSTQSLQKLCSDLRIMRQKSVNKANASHNQAQKALIEQNMAAVFQHSVDKAVHIRLAEAMKARVEQVEATLATLNQHTQVLENLLEIISRY